jgi:rod shape-determining protein MreC
VNSRPVATRPDRVAALVILLGLALLFLPHRTRLAVSQPFQTVLLAPLRLGALVSRSLRDLKTDNERLSLLAARLSVENARLESASHGAVAQPKTDLPLVRAVIISRDLATFQRSLVINQGLRAGIRPGSPVLTPQGVCGKVIACGRHQSLVQTILAPESRIAVLDLRSRVPALARTDRGGRLVLDYVPKESDFRAGDTIITAGLGTVFPKGLRLGEVIAVPDQPDALFKPVTVRPFADISRLEQVFVVRLPEAPGADPGQDWLENTAPSEVSIPDQPSNP